MRKHRRKKRSNLAYALLKYVSLLIWCWSMEALKYGMYCKCYGLLNVKHFMFTILSLDIWTRFLVGSVFHSRFSIYKCMRRNGCWFRCYLPNSLKSPFSDGLQLRVNAKESDNQNHLLWGCSALSVYCLNWYIYRCGVCVCISWKNKILLDVAQTRDTHHDLLADFFSPLYLSMLETKTLYNFSNVFSFFLRLTILSNLIYSIRLTCERFCSLFFFLFFSHTHTHICFGHTLKTIHIVKSSARNLKK